MSGLLRKPGPGASSHLRKTGPGEASPYSCLWTGVHVHCWKRLTLPCKATKYRNGTRGFSEIPYQLFSTIPHLSLSVRPDWVCRTQDLRKLSLLGLGKGRVGPESKVLLNPCSLGASLSLCSCPAFQTPHSATLQF